MYLITAQSNSETILPCLPVHIFERLYNLRFLFGFQSSYVRRITKSGYSMMADKTLNNAFYLNYITALNYQSG